MEMNSMEILKTIPFSELYMWDVNRYIEEEEMSSIYNIVRLSMVLQQSSNYEKIHDNKEYRLCGISAYGNGLFHREIKKGSA
jgi:hypothetical protein